MCRKYRILVVDDEPRARKKVAELLRCPPHLLGSDLEIAEASTVHEAKQMLLDQADDGFDLVILDWLIDDRNAAGSGDSTGDTLLRWMQQGGAAVPTDAIVLTGHGSDQIEDGVVELGAYHYADKPKVIGDANQMQADGSRGGPHSRKFLFHVRNCVERRRVRWRREQVIRVLQDLYRQLSGVRDFDKRLEAVVNCAPRLNPLVAKATIRVRHPDGHQRVALCGDEEEIEPTSGLMASDRGIAGHVFNTGEPYNCPDVSRDRYFVRTWARTKSELCIPVFGCESSTGGRPPLVAVLNLESGESAAFCEEDETAFRMLAEVASLTIQDMLLMGDVFRMAERINSAVHPVSDSAVPQPQDQFLDALANVELSQLKPLFEQLLEGALRLTNGQFGAVWLTERKRGLLRQIVDRGMGQQSRLSMTDIPFDAPRSIVAEVYRQRTAALATGSTELEAPLWGKYAPFFDDNGKGSFLCIPMLLGETVVGIIDIESPRPLAFSPLEMQVVEAYGRMAASALANLALMVSIRAKTTEEMKAALVSLTVHELTSPLNRVALDIERCEMLVEEARVDQLRDRLATAGATVKEATRRVREAVELAAKGNLISAEEVDLQALLQDVVHGARNATQGVRVELTNASNEVVFVRSNSHGLKLVVKELIANAEKACISAGRPDGTVRIHIKSSGNRICVFFADNGPGIPGEISTRLFKQPETASKGGFGLYKCRAMMQLHDGTLSLHKNSSAGATFKLAFLKVCAS